MHKNKVLSRKKALAIGVIYTKGGAGKTTLTANLGGLLADRGKRTLLIDGDRQKTLSKYYRISHKSPSGLTRLIIESTESAIEDCISRTEIDNLDLVYSDFTDGQLENFISERADGRFRLRHVIKLLRDRYDYILIDTRGADGHLMDMAIIASDAMVCPIPPDKVSTSEITTTIQAVERSLETSRIMGFSVGLLMPFVYRKQRIKDADEICDKLQHIFSTLNASKPYIRSLKTIVPHAQAYITACTQQIPAHLFEQTSRNKTPAAATVMNELLDEILMTVEQSELTE